MSIFVIFSRFQISSLGDNYSFVIHHRGRDAAEKGPSHGAALFYLDNYCISIVRGQVQTCRGDNKMQHGPGEHCTVGTEHGHNHHYRVPSQESS